MSKDTRKRPAEATGSPARGRAAALRQRSAQAAGPSRRAAPEGVLITRVLAVVGLVVAGVGAATGLVLEDWTSKPVLVLVGVASVLMVLFFLTNWRWAWHVVVTRKALISLNVLVMLIVATAILVMVNYISYRRFWRADVSRSQLYELSSQTRNILENLKEPVTVTVFYQPFSGEASQFGDYLKLLLSEYAQYSDRFSYEFVGLDEDPVRLEELSKKYEVTLANTVVVSCGQQRKNISASEIVHYGGGMYGMPSKKTYFGEPALTGAVVAVTEAKQKKVYFLTGHGERSPTGAGPDGYSTAASELRGTNYEVADPLNLLAADDLPGDCDLLVVASPKQPYSPREVEALRRYLSRGGPALFLLDPYTDEDYRFIDFGFESLLPERGVEAGQALVLDTASSLDFAGIPIPVSYAAGHQITGEMSETTTAFQMARPVTRKPAGPGGYTATELLHTSEKSWGETSLQTEDSGQPTGGGTNLVQDTSKHWRPNQWTGAVLILVTGTPGGSKTATETAAVVANTADTVTISGQFSDPPDGQKLQQYYLRTAMSYDEGRDKRGPLALAVASSRREGGGPMSDSTGEEVDRLVLVGDSDFASNRWLSDCPGNGDFFLNCVSWLVGKSEEIGIRPKSPEQAGLSLSTRQMKAVVWVVLVGIPAAVILLGCAVWWLRRLD